MKLKPRLKGVSDIGRHLPVALKPVTRNVERLVSVAIIRDGQTHHGFKSHAELRASLNDADPYKRNSGDTEGFWTSLARS
jgi:hypothetical protein